MKARPDTEAPLQDGARWGRWVLRLERRGMAGALLEAALVREDERRPDVERYHIPLDEVAAPHWLEQRRARSNTSSATYRVPARFVARKSWTTPRDREDLGCALEDLRGAAHIAARWRTGRSPG